MKRIALICEVMHEPFDEGIRIFAAELSRALAVSEQMKLLLLSTKDSVVGGMTVHGVLENRYFVSRRLAGSLGSFAPEAIVYVPWTSLTARTLIRVRALKRYAPGRRVALIALQPRPADFLSRLVAGLGRPDIVLAAGPGAMRQAERLGIPSTRVSPGVDLARFRPASAEQRAQLRQRAGIDPRAFVVLHVGHMKESRNIGVIEQLAKLASVACVVVGSTSTMADTRLTGRLRAAGVTVMTHHEDRIEFAYRLADAYLFPVISPLDAIETPLSVLEAAACDLAIVSTPFGGLPDLLGKGEGGVKWAGTSGEMVEVVRGLVAARGASRGATPSAGGTRRLVEKLSWAALARQVVAALGGAR